MNQGWNLSSNVFSSYNNNENNSNKKISKADYKDLLDIQTLSCVWMSTIRLKREKNSFVFMGMSESCYLLKIFIVIIILASPPSATYIQLKRSRSYKNSATDNCFFSFLNK